MIGQYHLLELIGEGGMGEVWLADQKHPVRRRVALKLIKAGMDTREVVARFGSERQALALMDHPAIAMVFDAGSTAQGRPYFVMEYVAGIPFTTYCDKHKLTTRARLEVLVRVCEGVQHAHQKAIIHRDLKPSNILVTEVDSKPVPKIIDFGVAKAISHRLTAETMFTQLGAIVGTPEYISPEQADSAGVDVDTRTDVYSLGVILYELLVGALPLELRKMAFDEMLRKLREEDAPKPSTKLRTLGEQSNTNVQNRRTEAATLRRQLRGDLDAIALKALEKERSRRYGTPSEMGSDIGRYLLNEPVVARPASVGYRARKYIRRHRVGVSVITGLVVLLATFAVLQALQLRRVTRERDRADRITTFMTSMFKVSNPSELHGNKVTAREILDNASKNIGKGLASDPELQAQMMNVMGTVYGNLGLYSQAEPLLLQALDIRRRVLGERHPDTLRSMNNLALVLNYEGQYAESEKLDRAALQVQRVVLGPEHPETLQSLNDLAGILRNEGHYTEAEKLHRQVLETRRRVLGREDPQTLDSLDDLSSTLNSEGRFTEAEKLRREALEIGSRVLGPEHPQTLRSLNNLSNTLYDEARYAEAEQLRRQVLEARRRVLGPEHPDVLTSMDGLANTLDNECRHGEAEKLHREVLDIQRRVLGPQHPNTLLSMNNLAGILTNEGRYEEAETLNREVLEIQRRVLGPEHPETLYSMNNLASTLMRLGRYNEAEKLSSETREIQRRVLGPEHPDTAETTYNLGCIAAHRGRRDEALSLLRRPRVESKCCTPHANRSRSRAALRRQSV